MNFDERFLTELSDRNDILDVVGSYVSLSKKGGQNYFGLCPFHNEKTPSFSVNPSRQFYHCFGCGKGGDVISFIMDIEGLTFPEAVEFLAKRAGMALPEDTSAPGNGKRERLYAINKDAARFFYSRLCAPEGAPAQEYLRKRQISPGNARNFGLGFAPDTWNSLLTAMREKGYTDRELLEAGLVKPGKNGGYYDAFRNRLIFPVIDLRGNVVAFSGRILGDGEPKYLNSPDTPVYSKGKNLFGMNLAKRSRRGYLILVEGNVDVVMLHQAGYDCAVAALGTALTAEQAKMISRYVNEVILAYDSDGAGQKAAQRAIEIFQKLDIKTRVLRMEGAKDPDEYIKSKGRDAFQALIDRSENQVDYRLDKIRQKYDFDIPEQKVDYLKEASRLVASFPDTVTRQVYSSRVAALAGVRPEVVSGEVERQRKSLFKKAQAQEDKQAQLVSRTRQPSGKSLRYDNVASAVAEEGVIRLMCLDPSVSCDLKAEEFSSPALGHIYEALCQSESRSAVSVSGKLTPDEMSLLVKIQQLPENLSNAENTMKDYISKIRNDSAVTDLRDLANKLKNEGKGYHYGEKNDH